MKLQDIFVKPVNRKIEGVIKADDDQGLRNEVEEYVLTNEVEKRLEKFLDAYNNYANANGVWISGFFGSGKSHLLKMMAMLLANREIDGISVHDSFEQKCEDNKILVGALKKAISIPTESILFNIDQKADIISKKDMDALLSVFVKVFDEHCGYYGKLAYVAQFERKLDQDDLLADFKTAFEKHEGQPWTWGCEQIIRVSSSIDAAFQEVTGAKETGVIDKFRSDYQLSIEDFALQVRDYIKRKPKNFRLNFFVDEVGQYVADNTKLMTNLQTVAESLASRCNGQAWIIVTAQEDMNTVVGETGKQQSNDFTKIQARFANRMKLTSADVAEVIQKRLLKKTDTGVGELEVLYDREKNNFRTLLDFDGGMELSRFKSQEHFVSCYPFIPYQFDLFQLSIRNLSQHNAFEGKHSSVGERSMLGVFQEVAKRIADHELGELATFDLMFEGIRSALKGPIQQTINLAEGNLENELDIRLVKTLFLVKYVQEFKASVRNLCVLMLDHFDQDVAELKKRIEESLNRLVNQVYIQRTGDIYEFLTDEEKDVEQEIKSTEVDAKDVAEELEKIVFNSIVKSKKLRYSPNKQDFAFTRKLDDRAFSREQDLAVHVISPFHDQSENHDQLKLMYSGKSELLVVLPADDRVMLDLVQYKKTKKYVDQNISMTQKDTVQRILNEKRVANQHRISDITKNVSELIGKAKLYVAGHEVESKSENPQSKIEDGFEQLVVQTYKHLKMLRGITYTEDKIAIYLEDDGGLFDKAQISEAEMEIMDFLNRRKNGPSALRTSLKDLTDAFEKTDYGWPLAAIQCFVAQLVNRGKLQIKQDSEVLDGKKLVAAVKKTSSHSNLLLEAQLDVPASKIRQLKDFYQHFFDKPAKGTDARGLEPEVACAFGEMQTELSGLASKISTFPFLRDLNEPLAQINTLAGKKSFFDEEFDKQKESLLDLKENVLDPVRNFMAGSQAKLFKETQQFVSENDANFSYVEGDEAEELKTVLTDPKCYTGKAMQGVKTKLDALKGKIDEVVARERLAVETTLLEKAEKLKAIEGFDKLPAECKTKLEEEVGQSVDYIRNHVSIPVVREYEKQAYSQLLNRIETKIQKASSSAADPTPAPPVKESVQLSSVNVPFSQPWIANAEDVENYLGKLRASLLAEIEAGKRVQV